MLTSGILSIDSNETVRAAFRYALKHGCLELGSDLLRLPVSSGDDEKYPGVKYRRRDFLSKMLKKDVDVNTRTESCTPLFEACEKVDVVSARMLLKRGADPNLSCTTVADLTCVSKTPLLTAVEN